MTILTLAEARKITNRRRRDKVRTLGIMIESCEETFYLPRKYRALGLALAKRLANRRGYEFHYYGYYGNWGWEYDCTIYPESRRREEHRRQPS